MLLGYPLYFALLVINGRFYAKVAEKSYQLQNKNQQQAKSAPSIAQSLATTIYMSIFYANCGVFATLLRMIPNIGIFLSFIMNCFILAYYSFEFRWLYMQWPLEKRLAYVEQHWSFFLGFGLPGTVTTFFLSSLRAGAMFALFYPSFIIMAFMALPSPTSASGVPASLSVTSGTEFMLPNTVPVFYPVRQMNKVVIQLVKLIGGVRVESIMADKKTANVKSERKAQ
ncbi:etoposide-induced protein 2.4-domain-containing protein [Gongronella butleri]|nr:etoposide-induced protein 2.4-domain-containing protein [Gongronella butleri]